MVSREKFSTLKTKAITNVTRNLDSLDGDTRSETGISYLVVLAGDSIGRVIRLKPNSHNRAGRVRECDLFFDCENISREHALFEVLADGHATITDLKSTNGTMVNGKRVDHTNLEDGDRICMGNVILRYCYKDGLEYDFQQSLYDKATRDPLTHLYNKRFFSETLSREFAFHHRHKQPLSVLLFDLDHFKRINDTHGHITGDRILKAVGEGLAQKMRMEDTFARFGGEEFVGMFRATDKDDAMAVAEKLRLWIADLEVRGQETVVRITATFGVATMVEGNYDSAEELMMAADNNLYIGKTRGRNQVIG